MTYVKFDLIFMKKYSEAIYHFNKTKEK